MMRPIGGGSGVLAIAAILAGLACNRPDPSSGARAAADSAVHAAVVAESLLVSAEGVGPIHLGAMLGEARQATPTGRFARASDGEGAALVGVDFGGEVLLYLSAGEENPVIPIDWTRRIEHIEVAGPAMHTAEGVHPGSLVTDVERVYGKVTDIVKSEIEQREYVTFANQPAWLTLRLDDAGAFAEGERRTTRFAPDARILSLSIAGRP